jgi:hypothetical protein
MYPNGMKQIVQCDKGSIATNTSGGTRKITKNRKTRMKKRHGLF